MLAWMKKHKILLVVELLCIAILVPGCFAKEELILMNDECAGNTQSAIYNIALEPGVYQIRVAAEAQEDETITVDMGCWAETHKALRTNGVRLAKEQGETTFEAYVYDNITTAYIECTPDGSGFYALSIEIVKLNWGSRMLVFGAFVGCFLLNMLVWLREKILAGTISKEKQIAIWMMLLGVAIAYFPYATDYFTIVADGAFHLQRIEGLARTLGEAAQFPVRVQSYWLYDHGYAVSMFYGDTFLVIPALFRLIGFSIMASYKMFLFLVIVATTGVAYYSFKKCTGNVYAAAFGSFLYTVSPYFIYNIYNRQAVGEYLGMIFLPLIISGMFRLYTEDMNAPEYRRAKLPLIIGLSCLLQTHLLTCEMMVVFILLICICRFKKTFQKPLFVELLKTAFACLGLTCWFYLPLFLMMQKDKYLLNHLVEQSIQAKGTVLASIVQFYPNRGGAQTGMYNAEPLMIGIASTVMTALFLICYIKKLRSGEKRSRLDNITCFFALGVCVLVFMSTKYFPWDLLAKIPVIKFFVTSLQFPTRLLSPATAMCAMFAAFFFLWTQEEKGRLPKGCNGNIVQKGTIVFVVVLALGSAVYHVNDIAFSATPIRMYSVENMGTMHVVNGEYLLQESPIGELKYHRPVAEEGVTYSDYVQNGTNISMMVRNETEQERYLELPLLGYKGYQVSGNGAENVPYITEQRGAHGDLRIAIPAEYEGEIQVAYKGFVSFRIAEMVSLFTLIGFVVAAYYRRRKEKSHGKKCEE